MSKTIFVTGVAGFIGAQVADRLLETGLKVVGVDSLNDYYDVRLKRARLCTLLGRDGFEFYQLDLSDKAGLASILGSRAFEIDTVVHLAAQAGVRYSLVNPHAYIDSNIVGFLNVLEGCRSGGIKHLIYASSSSVYGGNTKVPFSEADLVDQPVSLYAATKKSNELMAHVYSHLYGIYTTGLRFFTVYGPWGRPDMSPSLFMGAILNERPIKLFNNGLMRRDFTYISDVVKAILSLTLCKASPKNQAGSQRYNIYNVGNSQPVELQSFVGILERLAGRKARIELAAMQPGDVEATYADCSALADATGVVPSVSLEEGLTEFARWFISFYKGGREWCPPEPGKSFRP